MHNNITCKIEPISIEELLNYMRFQANEAFPSLKDNTKLLAFATKLHENAEFCLCRDEGKLVGMIAYYANGQGADFTYIPHVYVSPNYRKVGLFSRMLNTIEKYVQEKGFSEIRLEVEKENVIAQSVYLRKGFTSYGDASLYSMYLSKKI